MQSNYRQRYLLSPATSSAAAKTPGSAREPLPSQQQQQQPLPQSHIQKQLQQLNLSGLPSVASLAGAGWLQQQPAAGNQPIAPMSSSRLQESAGRAPRQQKDHGMSRYYSEQATKSRAGAAATAKCQPARNLEPHKQPAAQFGGAAETPAPFFATSQAAISACQGPEQHQRRAENEFLNSTYTGSQRGTSNGNININNNYNITNNNAQQQHLQQQYASQLRRSHLLHKNFVVVDRQQQHPQQPHPQQQTPQQHLLPEAMHQQAAGGSTSARLAVCHPAPEAGKADQTATPTATATATATATTTATTTRRQQEQLGRLDGCSPAGEAPKECKAAQAPVHVNFNRSANLSPEAEGEHGESRKKKYLTAKYGQQQMNLIKKRLKIEEWLCEQLQELAKGSKSEAQLDEVDIDFDQLIDLDDDDTRRAWLKETLAPFDDLPPEKVQKFIEEVLEQSRLL